MEILQARLNELGFNCGAVDGSFGPATYNAVINFQIAYGLEPDGVVGPLTRAKLFEVDPIPVPAEREWPAADALKGKVVIIDPGHGGYDPGAVHNGVYEKNLALDIGLRLRNMLEQAGATVYMTRSDDRYVSLFYRSAFANKVVLDMEIEEQQNSKAQAEQEVSDKQAEISASEEDRTNLEDYREILVELEELVAQYPDILLNSSAEQSGEQSDEEVDDAHDEGESSEETASEIEEEIIRKLALADELRSALSQKVKDQIYLGNETLTIEQLSELNQIIVSLDSAADSINLEIQTLEQEMQAAAGRITACETEIAELKRLLSGFQAYFDNPAYKERTGIYQYGTSRTASEDLKKVMDLTREKYQKDVIYVSIHLNATVESTQTYISGMYLFYRNNSPSTNTNYYKNYNTDERYKLSLLMLQETNKATDFAQNSSKPLAGDYSVLRENNLVSTLVEVGFMNNPNDLAMVVKDSVREDAAYGMLKGIVAYFK